MYQTRLNDRNLRRALLLGAASVAALGFSMPANAQVDCKANPTDPSCQSAGAVETVVVTGSRIPQTGLIAPSPVTAVSQQELKFEGTSNVETLLNNLPGVFAAQNENVTNGGTGTATVNLRGIGPSRTLVLVDSARLMPADPSSVGADVPDLNNIPAALVDHVEVLTGGASAVYGSDALAGVVNFIMRKDFEGAEVDAQYQTHNTANGHKQFDDLDNAAGGAPFFTPAPKNFWGGEIKNATFLIGTNTADGKGNITAYLAYRNAQPILESKRDFSACALGLYPGLYNGNTGYYDLPGTRSACIGSSNFNNFRSIDNRVSGLPRSKNNFFEVGSGTPNTQGTGDGHFVKFTGAPSQRFNYGPLNFLQRSDNRYNGGYFAHYEVNKQFQVYSNFMFADDRTQLQIAQSALFAGSGPTFKPGTFSPDFWQINCDNPLMTPSENKALCGSAKIPSDTKPNKDGTLTPRTLPVFVVDPRFPAGGFWNGGGNLQPGFATLDLRRRLVEDGNRIQDVRHTSYRMIVGAKGDLGEGWSYDIYGQYGLTLFTESDFNDLSKTRSQQALNAHFLGNTTNIGCGPLPSRDPVTGLSQANTNINPSCVPLDVFNGIGAITKAQQNFINNVSLKHGWTEEQVVSGSLTGDLGQWGIQSPWAKSPVAVSVGAEYRQERLKFDVSENLTFPLPTGDSTGIGNAFFPVPVSGFNVKEGFGELRIPVIQNMPFVEDLTVRGAYRYASYSNAGSTNTYEVATEWQPIDDVRFRASYQRAVRAPSVLELFSPDQVELFGGQDPCASSTTGGCAGVPNAGSGKTGPLQCPASQCNQFAGGNVNLKPETSITRSAGIVFTPTFIDGFTATVDYFDINVANAIGGIPPTTTVAQCASTGAAFFCNKVHRDADGQIFGAGFVDATNVNTGAIRTRGMDFESNYQTQFSDWSALNDAGLGGLGGISANFVGTLLERLSFDNNAAGTPVADRAPITECAGRYGVTCLEPSPRWRHKLRVTWSSPWDFDFSVQWRHISGSHIDADSAGAIGSIPSADTGAVAPCTAGASYLSCNPNFGRIAAFEYFDLAVNWHVFEGIQLRAGVNNVFDKEPPALDSGSIGLAGSAPANANTYPGLYDSLGRTIFVGGTVKF